MNQYQNKIITLVMSVTIIYGSNVASAFDFTVDGICYNILSQFDLTCEVTSNPDIYDGDIIIPAYVNNGTHTYKVTAIGDNAFNEREYNVSRLMSIILPNTIEKIGINAFYCCGGLESLELPDSLEIIENNAFAECLNIRAIEIPKSVTKIGHWAFHNCYMLKKFVISNGEKPITIPMRALRHAGNNMTLYIGRSIINDDESELWVSPMIIEVADGITVGNLWNSPDISKNLEELKIGRDVIDFPVALSSYAKLKMLYTNNIIPPVCPIVTDNQYKDITIVVPADALATYKSTEGWKNFYNIIEGYIDDIKTIEGENTAYQLFNLMGKPVNYNYKGIILIRYSNGKTLKTLLR